MKKQAVNPYLPLYEYIPDGEPYVFGDRVYIYGSHDYASGTKYCEGDYVVWSAPVDDLGNWEYGGVTYRKDQDPSNKDGKYQLWAPDVARGADGRYYLYYCLSFVPEFGVAVSDSPAGPFEFYGHIKYNDAIMGGKKIGEYLPFDPGVLVDDDGRVFLYYGFSPVKTMPVPDESAYEHMEMSKEQFLGLVDMINNHASPGGMVVELEEDMLTAIGEPHMAIPGGKLAKGTSFEGYGYYEAASMRKINGKYYFIYSNQLSHQLSYAVSDKPDSGFTYGGVLISNGDVGLDGNEEPVYVTGNNHGSLLKIKEDWYVFYHRQTHGTESSRQGCAEKVVVNQEGSIDQVEITSCGLNGGPLKAEGTYSAAIACHLTSSRKLEKIQYGESLKTIMPVIYEDATGDLENDYTQYITNIFDGVKVGFKYFEFSGELIINVVLKGEGEGSLIVSTDLNFENIVGKSDVNVTSKEWTEITIKCQSVKGIYALYFTYNGTGALDFKEISFQ